MGPNSHIEWTDATWNPLAGCDPVSPGCTHCYAATMARRLGAMAESDIASGRSPGGKAKYIGVAERRGSVDVFNGTVNLDHAVLSEPFGWKKPRRIFVNSMSDLFHEAVPWRFIDTVMWVMGMCPEHTFQVLTKRADRLERYVAGLAAYNRGLDHVTERMLGPTISTDEDVQKWCDRHGVDRRQRDAVRDRLNGVGGLYFPGPLSKNPLPFQNVLLGVSVEDQARADLRRDDLKEVAELGWQTFVSYEPALGPVNWSGWEFLRWMIVGGESGHDARPFDCRWAYSAIEWCKAANVACFVKQMGSKPVPAWAAELAEAFGGGRIEGGLKDRKGGDWSEWPADLRVREVPEVTHAN